MSFSSWGIHLQPFGGLLLDRESLYYLRLDAAGVEVALQLSRTRSLKRTARLRCQQTNRDSLAEETELRNALSGHPVTASWLDGELDEGLRISGRSDAFLPILASLQLTNACNLRCSFCYASSGKAFKNELTADEWLKVIEQLAATGVASLTFTGGEPTIVRSFPRLLMAASAMVESVDIFTNALAWPEELVELVAACGNVDVQVSVDGTEPHHDSLRGRKGSYAAALATIKRLAEAQVNVTVAMTVSPANVRDLSAVIADVDRAGARAFRAGRVVNVGRGDRPTFTLTPEQDEMVDRALDQARSQGLDIEIDGQRGCVNIGDELGRTGLPVEFMTPGFMSWHVRPDGNVTPCQVEAESLGNVRDEPLSDIGCPERLAKVRARARGCGCIGALRLPEESGLPFGISAQRSISCHEECSCQRQSL